jgi:Leucine-rich repeat (LRR) protein
LLSCHSNQLTSLDVSANTALESLHCSDNQLTSLDLSANTDLRYLSCSTNQLIDLDVRANTKLGTLKCGRNLLTRLDLSANTDLRYLSCSDNPLLNNINIRNGNNTAITSFFADNNPFLHCISVDDAAYAETNWTEVDEAVVFCEEECVVYIPDA